MPKIMIDLDDDTYRLIKNELIIISGMRSYKTAFNRMLDAIANGKPIVHGKWIESHTPESMLCECNVCGFHLGAYSFNYCPNCGAGMRGDTR